MIRNDSDEPRSINAYLTARSVYYTGVNASLIKKAEGKFNLGPKQQQVSRCLNYCLSVLCEFGLILDGKYCIGLCESITDYALKK